MRTRKGFTLMELIIVVIIIGILAMIGMPQMIKVTERSRAAEAFHMLGILRDAQLRYSDQAANGTTSATCANLDITLPTNFKYFGQPTCAAVASPATTGAATTIASMTRSDAGNAYTCSIAGGGTITCSGGTAAPANPN